MLVSIPVIGVILVFLAASQQVGAGPARGVTPGSVTQPSAANARDLVLLVTSSPNPLRELAKQLQWKLGVPLSYEEPAWAAADDLMPLIDSPSMKSSLARDRIAATDVAAKVGSIDVRFPIDLRTQDTRDLASAALSKAIADHKMRSNPGTFKITDLGRFGFSIVPLEIKDRTGRIGPTTTPLDARISLPDTERSTAETLKTIGRAVSAAAGVEVNVDTTAAGVRVAVFEQTTTRISAQNETARTVLARALGSMYYTQSPVPIPKFSWNLIYEPNAKAYTLRFQIVARDAITTGPGVGPSTENTPRSVVYW